MDWTQIMEERDDKGQLTDLAIAADALDDLGCDCGTDEPGSCLLCVCERAIRKLVDDIAALEAALEAERGRAEKAESESETWMLRAASVIEIIQTLRPETTCGEIQQWVGLYRSDRDAALARAETAEADAAAMSAGVCSHLLGDAHGNPTCYAREQLAAARDDAVREFAEALIAEGNEGSTDEWFRTFVRKRAARFLARKEPTDG